MLPEIKNLLVLQDKDQKIQRLEKDIARIPAEEENARERLSGDTAAVAEIKEAIMQNEVAIKNFELDVQTRRDTITKLKVQQYETKKNEEYTALGQEVVRYENEVTALEDQEIELMEKAEDLKSRLADAESKLSATQNLVDEELASLSQRQANENGEIATLQNERTEIAGQVEESLLSRYERLLKNKGDAAVVGLEQGICTGCRMKLIASTVHAVKAENEPSNCEQCGRILYFVE